MTINLLSSERTIWINIVRPTTEDVNVLRNQFPFIHPLNLEDILSRIERPKIDDDDNYVFVVMQFPFWDPQKRISRPSEVDLFVGRGFLVTAHDGTLRPLQRLYDQCTEDPERLNSLLGRGASHAFYAVIDSLVDYILPMLYKVDTNIRGIEEEIFTARASRVIRDIALVRRDVIALRRIIRQQVPIVENLERNERPIIHEDLDDYFGDIVDHLYRARDIVDEHSEIIAGLSETADTLVSNRVNDVMRVLTVISVIMLPLTLISSVYGMNIPLPLQNDANSFIIISGLMIGIALVMLVYFRWRNWL